ncbi:Clavaminate synthase-like protein [Aaosphaeria arxii CBS 175.79]|uniref:Clavaminate synthase-like protein n=1 Tax=Aaosphaeria arxii CBS 175.79 TaxID=1450172 RepID=A0A6A5XTX1_9PLEO|nr:Clavaminate synthase-like protein [Aaosphaeria arxii CBS 175.79]KAF2016805.1 Clavaminate synthase-like protein [Aaosphaeria arxii CBS 175.79]
MPSSEQNEALQQAGTFDAKVFYPAEFPPDVPTIALAKFSLALLLNNDKDEAQRLFNTCRTTGFFYLDMLDHPTGRRLWRSACNLHQIGRERFRDTPIEKKMEYKTRPGVRVFDRGYLMRSAYAGQQNADLEIVNIPQSEFFGTKDDAGAGLPGWFSEEDQSDFKTAMECGNSVARGILSVLEKKLDIPRDSLASLHSLTDDSGDFVRILRYGGVPPSTVDEPEGFPPHRDAMSIAILFNWLGGLQIPSPEAEVNGYVVKDEDWRWVKPEAGYAIVNLGDAMAIFSNNLLKSQIHRVVKAPGDQRQHDRLSIIVATRPKNTCLMMPFESSIIPPNESTEVPITSLEWGYNVVSKIRQRAVARGATDLDNIVNPGNGGK